jgi:hypothetical protein
MPKRVFIETIIERESRDEVLAEVRRIKEELAAAQNFDVHRIAEEARREQTLSGRQILLPPARPSDKKFHAAAELVLAKNAELYQRLV